MGYNFYTLPETIMGLMDLFAGVDYQPRSEDEQAGYWDEAYEARTRPDNLEQAQQNLAAQDEHMEWAREYAGREGLPGYAAMMMLTPAWEAAKYTGLMGGRSEPSWESMGAGFRGANQGLMDYLN